MLVLPLACLAVVACGQSDADVANGDDPMEALEVPHLSERYNTAYWTQTSAVDPELWAQAVEFCESLGRDLRDYPNCNVVRSVKMLMPQPLEDQPDTFDLTVEPFGADTTDSR